MIVHDIYGIVRFKGSDKEEGNAIPESPITAEEKWAKRVRQENSKKIGKYQQAPKKQLKITAA